MNMTTLSKVNQRIVYVLKNKWYRDDLRKVGKTTQMLGRKGRLTTLLNAGVPDNFDIVFAIVCDEEGAAKDIEDSLHTMWKDNNINDSRLGSREWFEGIPDTEYEKILTLLVNTSRGRIQWWTEDNDTPCYTDDELEEEELQVSFHEDSPTIPVVRYDHSLTTVDTYPLLTEKEKGAFQISRRRAQGFFKKPFMEAVKHLNRKKTMEWDDKRLSWVLLRDDYEWLTPELRSMLKDCF